MNPSRVVSMVLLAFAGLALPSLAEEDRWAADRKVTTFSGELLETKVGPGRGLLMRRAEGGRVYEIDGKPGATWDEVTGGMFSPDGETFVYQAKKGGEWRVVVAEKPGDGYERLVDVGFLPDGKTVAYRGVKGGKWFLVVGGTTSEEFDVINEFHVSADGAHRAWIAGHAGDVMKAYLDGKVISGADEACHIAFQSGGKPVYVVRTSSSKTSGKTTTVTAGVALVVGGSQKPLNGVNVRELETSRDGASTAVAVEGKDGKVVVSVDGKAWEAVDELDTLQYTADGKALATVKKDGKKWLVLDGKKTGPYEDIVKVFTAPAGRTVVAAVKTSASECSVMVLGGASTGSVMDLGAPAFTTDGKSVAYSVYRSPSGKGALVVDGKVVGEHESIGNPVFLGDGRAVCVAQDRAAALIMYGDRSKTLLAGDGPLDGVAIGPAGNVGIYVERNAAGKHEIWWRVITLE